MVSKEQAVLDGIKVIQEEQEYTFKASVASHLQAIVNAQRMVADALALLEEKKQALVNLEPPTPPDLNELVG